MVEALPDEIRTSVRPWGLDAHENVLPPATKRLEPDSLAGPEETELEFITSTHAIPNLVFFQPVLLKISRLISLFTVQSVLGR